MLISYITYNFPEAECNVPDHQLVVFISDDQDGIKAIFKFDFNTKIVYVVLVGTDTLPINSDAFFHEVDRLMKCSDASEKIKKDFDTMSKKIDKEFHAEAVKFINVANGKDIHGNEIKR